MQKKNNEAIELIEQQMGKEIAQKLCALFGGEAVYFPKNYYQHEKIYAEWEKGKSYKQLAKKYNLTQRQIRTIIEKELKKKQKKLQLELEFYNKKHYGL